VLNCSNPGVGEDGNCPLTNYPISQVGPFDYMFILWAEGVNQIESLQLILLIILSFYRQRVSMTVERAQAVTILHQDVATTEDASSRLMSF